MDLSTSASYGRSYWPHPLVNKPKPPLSVDNICHSVCSRRWTPFLCPQNLEASCGKRPDCSCTSAVDCIFIAAAAQGRALPCRCVPCRMLHCSRLHQPAPADCPTMFPAFLEAPFTALHCFIHFTGDASRRSAMRRHRFQLRGVSCHMGHRGKPAQRPCHRRLRRKRMASPALCFPAVFYLLLVLALFCFESGAFVTCGFKVPIPLLLPPAAGCFPRLPAVHVHWPAAAAVCNRSHSRISVCHLAVTFASSAPVSKGWWRTVSSATRAMQPNFNAVNKEEPR
jgi:hypothetical protein